MNILKALGLVLLVAACTSTVRAEEVAAVTVTATDSGVKIGLTAGPSAAAPTAPTAQQRWEAAEQRRDARMAAAAERAGLSFWEARTEDAAAVWNGARWAACKVAQGTANADGYVAAAIAVPAGYVAGSAFSGAEAAADAAASIK